MEVYDINKKYKNRTRENLANNILSMRYERDWSQEKLAELAHSSAVYISNIEQGKRNVSIDFIDNIAKIFGVPTYKMLIENPKIQNRGRVDSKK